MAALLNRQKLKAVIAYHNISTPEMCDMLGITNRSYYEKIEGKRGFTEVELETLLFHFGKSIFFTKSCSDSVSIKEV